MKTRLVVPPSQQHVVLVGTYVGGTFFQEYVAMNTETKMSGGWAVSLYHRHLIFSVFIYFLFVFSQANKVTREAGEKVCTAVLFLLLLFSDPLFCMRKKGIKRAPSALVNSSPVQYCKKDRAKTLGSSCRPVCPSFFGSFLLVALICGPVSHAVAYERKRSRWHQVYIVSI